MASLSLPRVLQLKKNSLDAEREQFEKFQTLAIQKAINAIETPVKEKHVRSTIIGTFQEQSAVTYWMVAIRLPIQDNRIVAWKFCHVTHKLLREGHPACLDDSQRHIGMIENLGKLWVHLREGYGKLVHLYCNLLVCKLKFHSRNPRFPGNMQLTADELDAIAENDVNNYFQLCVELFDYMEDILNLQAAVFDSLGNARANSMTASGQCRLAALIPCAQDASQIYDCNVRLLFRLHASLPPDTLAGHRERFRQQFKKLSSFYKHASSLQYYRNLLTLPVLPSNPPNFLLQSDFGTYVTPVVTIPELPPDEVDSVGSLIDTSDTMSQAPSEPMDDFVEVRPTPSPQPDPIVERDRLIDHLQNELKRMRSEVSQLVQERNNMLGSMKEHCARLESQLQTARVELEEEKQKAELLSVQTPEIKQKLTETEEKAKIQDEKFQKLKGAYTQLREEHIALIRQKAEVDKLTASLKAAAANHETDKLALQQKLNDKIKDVELLQQSALLSDEIEGYKDEISYLRGELENERHKQGELETLKASMQALEIEHHTAQKEHEEKLATVMNELKETTDALQQTRSEKDSVMAELTKLKEDVIGHRAQSDDQYKRLVEEKDMALSEMAKMKEEFQQEKEAQSHLNNNTIVALQSIIDNLQNKIIHMDLEHDRKCRSLTDSITQSMIMDHEKRIKNKDKKIEECAATIENLEHNLKLKTQEARSNKKAADDFMYARRSNERENSALINQIDSLTDKLNKRKMAHTRDQELLIENNAKLKELEVNFKFLKYEAMRLVQDLKEALRIGSTNAQQLQICESRYERIVERKLKGEPIHEIPENPSNLMLSDFILAQKAGKFRSDLDFGDKNIFMQSPYTGAIPFGRHPNNREMKVVHALFNKLDEDVRRNTKIKQDIDLVNLYDKATKELEKNAIKFDLSMLNSSKINELNAILGPNNMLFENLHKNMTDIRNQNSMCRKSLVTLEEKIKLLTEINRKNLDAKDQELRDLEKAVNDIINERAELKSKYERLLKDYTDEGKVLENHMWDLQKCHDALKVEHEEMKKLKKLLTVELNQLTTEHTHVKEDRAKEIKALKEKIRKLVANHEEDAARRSEAFSLVGSNLKDTQEQVAALERERSTLTEALHLKDDEIQMLENKLEHAESKRLNAECELQDLLQHNTVLEADLAAAKKQLEDTQKALEKQSSKLVSCAGEAAVEVTTEAIAAFDNANAHDTISAAADLAAKALEQLSRYSEVSGNEESIAKSAIFAAHNTAQLSLYVADVSSVSTSAELADKLNTECRSMLNATKDCLESIKTGTVVSSACSDAQSKVRSMMTSAAAADRLNNGARTVDDELADMDRAIEEAASQIESLLAATRAADTGVKLEVNGKILDACTTLMGAVKILVQDARKLQNELGDPKTRQKMYRKNPQWSEGLISAAKAVVFAAKLLVSSADEAVNTVGRTEGVSAAAQDVAGSTAQLVAASRARAPPASPALARLTQASRHVAAATGALVAAVKAGSALVLEQEALDTSSLSLTATRRLEMESKVRSLQLETALDAERARLAALRKRHYQLAQLEENGNMENGKD